MQTTPTKKRTLARRLASRLPIAYVCLIYIFLYLPIIVVIAFSFNTSKQNIVFEGFTFGWYARMFDNSTLMESFYNTLIVAFSSTAISVVIGTLCAVGLFKLESRLKSIISSSLYIPIAIPEIVFGISLLMFFSMIHLETGMLTVILSHVTFSMPFVVITVRSRIAGFDRSIEEAARDLGANELRTLMRVTVPMLMPGIISGGMLALTLSLDDVVISSFTTGPDCVTLPIKIMGLVKKGVSPDVNALSTMMIAGTVAVMVLSTVLQNRLEGKEVRDKAKATADKL
ncbi:MAG: ABC transporter permease [Oscillospiraceae bacterium]|jgi:spermidine/putrescine transport system permease protein|nr:ABC transporter permease [Oscillospiraceae bacterium]